MKELEANILEKIFEDGTGCDEENCPLPGGALPKTLSLAMAYVPYQQWEKPYEEEVGLSRGTVFPSLDKPFIGEEAVPDADA